MLFSGYTFPKNKVIPYQVKNSDIFPTLLELIGITNNINSDTTSLISKINDNDKTESDIFLQSITNSDDETVVGLRNFSLGCKYSRTFALDVKIFYEIAFLLGNILKNLNYILYKIVEMFKCILIFLILLQFRHLHRNYFCQKN